MQYRWRTLTFAVKSNCTLTLVRSGPCLGLQLIRGIVTARSLQIVVTFAVSIFYFAKQGFEKSLIYRRWLELFM